MNAFVCVCVTGRRGLLDFIHLTTNSRVLDSSQVEERIRNHLMMARTFREDQLLDMALTEYEKARLETQQYLLSGNLSRQTDVFVWKKQLANLCYAMANIRHVRGEHAEVISLLDESLLHLPDQIKVSCI